MTLVARLKATLSDVEPQVLRRFDVPLKIKLNRLHDVIQAAMGWTDSHLYEFRAGGVGWGVPDPDGYYDGPLPASKSSLLDVLEDVDTKTIHYIYDFGEGSPATPTSSKPWPTPSTMSTTGCWNGMGESSTLKRQRSAVSSTTSSASPKSGHQSRANQGPHPNASDQYGTATAFGGYLQSR